MRSRTARTGSRRAPPRRRGRTPRPRCAPGGRTRASRTATSRPPTAGWTSQGFTVPGFGWSGGTLQVVDGGLTGGKKMGRFTASGSGSPTISTSPDPVNASPAGVTYTARGSIRGMTSGRTICLKLREYQEGESSDTLVGSGQQCVTTNGSWQTLPTLTYTAPAGRQLHRRARLPDASPARRARSSTWTASRSASRARRRCPRSPRCRATRCCSASATSPRAGPTATRPPRASSTPRPG